MNKQAQVLMIFLWILVVLTILAVSIGRTASTTFRYIRYQKNRQKALYLAKAGVNRAVVELDRDNNGYDALIDSWADNPQVFEKITLTDNENEFSSVSYIIREGDTEEVKFGVADEEKRININDAPEGLIFAILDDFDISNVADIVKNIRIFRGDIPDDDNIYEELGYTPKADKFVNTNELMLVKGITPQDYENIKEYITVYTDGLININTVSERALNIAAIGVARQLRLRNDPALSLAVKILEAREINNGYFRDLEEINIATAGVEEESILNELMKNLSTESNNFFIEVTGKVGKIETKVSAVYNRKEKNFQYWHED